MKKTIYMSPDFEIKRAPISIVKTQTNYKTLNDEITFIVVPETTGLLMALRSRKRLLGVLIIISFI